MRMEPYTLREERMHDAIERVMEEEGVDEDEAREILEARDEDAMIDAYEARMEARAEAMADRDW